jgi:hypothetical protein
MQALDPSISIASHSSVNDVIRDIARRGCLNIPRDPRDTRPRDIPADGFVVDPRSMLLPTDVDDGAIVPGLDSWIVRLCGIERSGRQRGFPLYPPVQARVDSSVPDVHNGDTGALEALAFLSDLPVGSEAAFARACTVAVDPSHSERTIYGNPRVNLLFRAYHDRYHLGKGFAFDARSERIVGAAHVAHCLDVNAPPLVTLALLFDGLGQSLAFERDGRFPDDQRSFVAACMIRALSGGIADPLPHGAIAAPDVGLLVDWTRAMLPVSRF